MRTARRSERHGGTAILVTALLIFLACGAAGGAAPAAYVVGAGDLLEISVWGYPDLTRQIAIAPDAKITLPLVGTLSTAGMTVERLTALITKAYAEFIIDPRVIVTIREYRKLRVSVLGQVAKPGSYDLPFGAHLLDLIAAGGGPTDAAALKEAQLLRPGQNPIRIDLTRAMAGDPAANVRVVGGETLVVPEDLTGFVTVQGEVARPGRYRLKGEMRLLDVLALAGGLTERASISQASLVRASSQREPLDLDGLLLRQVMTHNLPIQAGDTLFVPEETNNKLYVVGDVKNPGAFTIKGQVTLLQAIAMAGGPEQRGAGTAQSAYVVRRNGKSAPQIQAGPARVSELPNGGTLITAELPALMRDPSKDLVVQPGDVLIIPQHQLGGLETIVRILSGIASIFVPFK
jgi:polysaccharide biosynthesis/export protein